MKEVGERRVWETGRPTWAEVNLTRFAYNLEAIAAHAPGAEMMPVVKANAYGHGDVALSRVAVEGGSKRLAVAIVDEAVALRKAGISADMVVLGYTPPSQAGIALEADVALTVFDSETLHAIEAEAAVQGRTGRIHIKVETGMNRIGVVPDEALMYLLETVRRSKRLRLEGVFTHFAAADEEADFTRLQLERFERACQMVRAAGFSGVLRHAANSAGILDFPEAHLDMVRPGLIMYGYYPSPTVSRQVAVKPPLAWYARIIQVKQIRLGDSVGYNRTYRAGASIKVASLPVGYADGYPRHLSNRGVVFLDGRPAPVIGRVCMDQLMIDVTSFPQAKPGFACTLLGPEHDAEDMSQLVGTIPHEILTGISPRVPRLYVRQ